MDRALKRSTKLKVYVHHEGSAPQNIGQPYCHNKPPSASPTHHASSESIPSQAHCLQLIEARSVLSLQEPLFGRKIGHLRKAKAGGTTCKTRFRPAKRYRGLYGLTSAGPASTKTDPPLARNFWRHPDANAAVRVLEGGV